MFKNRAVFFIIIAFLGSCTTHKMKLEKATFVNISEAYYQKWASGVRGGGTGLNIHISIDDQDINKKLIGLYFKGKYTGLKWNSPNMYTGFITTSNRKETNLDVQEIQKHPQLNEDKEHKAPFVIKDNEALVVALVNKKKKYFIIVLEKKRSLNFPQ